MIQIKVIGNPQPTYTWTRNGVALSSGNGVTVTHDSLTFNSVTRVHSGQYVYEAINTLGMSSLTFSLDVQCKLGHLSMNGKSMPIACLQPLGDPVTLREGLVLYNT